MKELPPTMREFSPINYAMARNDLDRDRIEHERLINRRDALRDKLRSGFAALNGGSLIALLAALNGEGGAAGWVGIDQYNAKWVAAAFAIGLMAAGWSYRAAETSTTSETGDSLQRVGAAERRIALYESAPTPENNDLLRNELEKYGALPLVGHRLSTQEVMALGLSQLAWTIGILVPLAQTIWC